MINREVETRNIKISFCNDGILRVMVAKDAELDIDESKEIIKKLSFNQQKWPTFADMRGIKCQSKTSRDYFASEEATRHVKAIAFLADSSVSIFLVNLYILLSKPEVPTRLFKSEEKAMEWLKDFLN